MDIFYTLLGLILIVLGGEYLLKSAVGISNRMNLSKVVIGMTVVSFATSAPELIVSIDAALLSHPDIALGNVVGSNIANLGLVLGIIALIGPVKVGKDFFRIDWLWMLTATILLFWMIFFDGLLSGWEGAFLFFLLIVFIVSLFRIKRAPIDLDIEQFQFPLYLLVGYLIVGGVCLWLGSLWLIDGAVGLAKKIGVTDRVIAISLVSVGTSIPELVASIIAVIKKEKGISLGNLLGSNVFNIFAVLGITSMIHPIKIIDNRLLSLDLWWMMGICVILPILVLLTKRNVFSLWKGILLLIIYVCFLWMLFR